MKNNLVQDNIHQRISRNESALRDDGSAVQLFHQACQKRPVVQIHCDCTWTGTRMVGLSPGLVVNNWLYIIIARYCTYSQALYGTTDRLSQWLTFMRVGFSEDGECMTESGETTDFECFMNMRKAFLYFFTDKLSLDITSLLDVCNNITLHFQQICYVHFKKKQNAWKTCALYRYGYAY